MSKLTFDGQDTSMSTRKTAQAEKFNLILLKYRICNFIPKFTIKLLTC